MAPVEVIDLTLSSPPPKEVSSLTLNNGERLRVPLTSPESSDKEQKIRSKRKGSSLNEANNDLFFVDLIPSELSTGQRAFPVSNGRQEELLLPQHVTVLASSIELQVQPLSDLEEEEDFINYEDYGDANDVVRYFHQPSDETTSAVRVACRNCGAEGLHKTSACRVQICLTCGARDEHSTRSCPISKVCFTCGMKGHINANCPNRRSSRTLLSEDSCTRCSALTHKTNECPTWWRLYEYFCEEDRDRILAVRHQKRDSKLGEGGEGYVADDEWCYNCGNAGHWGDDCDTFQHRFWSEEYSAFSKANTMKGPFYDPNNSHRSKSRVRNWEKFDNLSRMADVGRKGRLKSRVALEKQAMEIEHAEEDWFANAKNSASIPPSQQHTPSKRISFDRQNDRNVVERKSGLSLLDRIQMQPPNRHDSSARNSRPDRSNFEDRTRHTSQRTRDYGPRYRGGYGTTDNRTGGMS